MISIITSVHNQLGMNKLFYESLKANTTLPFELIVVDNASNDGSREFFEEKADTLIKNVANYSYPYCQNQGIAAAKYDYLAFLNNDLVLSKNWDEKIIKIMNEKGIDVISFATNDHLENKPLQRRLHKKWKRIKYLIRSTMGTNTKALKLMLRLMYGGFQQFCDTRYAAFGNETVEGFSGSCIVIKRSVFGKIGLWDEQMQGADFDLFFRTKERWLQYHDVKPIQIALGIYLHHFQRLTLRSKKLIPFADKENLLSLEEKWGDKMTLLYKDVVG